MLRALTASWYETVDRLRRLLRDRLRLWLVVLLALAVTAAGGYAVAVLIDDSPACAPPLELRVLTDPDLEPALSAAADAYLSSGADTDGDGCRRTGITVDSAGAADAVAALRDRTDAWQQPRDDDDPQRDVGPQPDVWVPASPADVTRVTAGQEGRVFAHVEPMGEPFAYSPVVLAVPDDAGAAKAGGGGPLAALVAAFEGRGGRAQVVRPDPEFTDAALLATIGLYGGAVDARAAERTVAQSGPPAPTAGELLCRLPDDPAEDRRTAVLAPEFLLKSGVGCASEVVRARRVAQYPDDVPALQPAFVRVRWEDGDRDAQARDDAVKRFHDWLSGDGGREVLGDYGLRSPDAPHRLLAGGKAAPGVLADPGTPREAAEPTAMNAALERYRGAGGPGQVLFLLDSSGSMAGLWEGPSGGPGLLQQSLGGLGDRDEYGVWAVAGTSGSTHTDLLRFATHRRADAVRALDPGGGARVRDAEADPHAALLDALEFMRGRGTDAQRPQLIVYLTDDEDNTRLTGRALDEVLQRARAAGVPVAMVSLADGGCDGGRPDARISAASSGRCLDPGDDLGAALHDEVARTGTGEE